MKICVITCYNDPDYVRARVLRDAVTRLDHELVVVKNSHKGLIRYPEVIWKLLRARLSRRPDRYILTFRGYEMFWPVRIVTLGKPLIFDEFINLIEWTVFEHGKIKPHSAAYWILWTFYRSMLLTSHRIMTDTEIHADYSAQLMKVSRDRFVPVPVATDEVLFNPRDMTPHEGFEVFYYGNMLPLHGIDVVLDALDLLADKPDIHLTLIGGKQAVADRIKLAQEKGANVTYIARVPFEALVEYAHGSDICLGGPFGNTLQAGMVITGKTYQFLACAKPTIIGKIPGETPFIDKQNCLLVDQGSPQALADAIRWSYSNRDKLPSIGLAARETYLAQLSTQRVAEILKTIL